MKKILLILPFLLTFGVLQLSAQVENEEIKAALQEQGISEQEFLQELENSGLSEEEFLLQVEEAGGLENIGLPQFPSGEPQEQEVDEGPVPDETVEEETEEVEEEEEEELEEEEEELPVVPELPEPTVYGQHIFRGNVLPFISPDVNFKAPANYIVGAGDEFSVAIWGPSAEFNGSYRVDDSGYIKPTGVPRIYVKGLNFNSAQEAIEKSFSNYYDLNENTIAVDINYARPLVVGVFGEVFFPGSYPVTALNTAFNALVASGGPSDNGSVRNIEIKSTNGSNKVLDVYKFLNDPSTLSDFHLDNNDVVFVPSQGDVIKIAGAISRPHAYELLPNEGLLKLIDYAGGLAPNAYKTNIQIIRFDNDQKILKDVNLNDFINSPSDFKLVDGDSITIFEIEKRLRNYVDVSGAVEVAGQYEIKEGQSKLMDVINKAGLREDAKLEKIYLLRKRDDLTNQYIKINLNDVINNNLDSANLVLKARDEIKVTSKEDFVLLSEVAIDGLVRKPGRFDYDENLAVSDLIYFAGGLRPGAATTAFITRKKDDETFESVRVNLDKALENPNSIYDVQLAPDDSLFIYPVSRFIETSFINVFGAVRDPGEFNYSAGMTLTDILYLSGGLKEEAQRSRVEVARITNDGETESTVVEARFTVITDDNNNYVLSGGKDFTLKPYDQVFVRSAPGFELQRNVEIIGEVFYPGIYPLVNKNEKIFDLIQRAGGHTEEAYLKGATLYRNQDSLGIVILDLDEVINREKSKYNYVLKEGDVIEIPKALDMVSVAGAIKYPEIELLKRVSAPYFRGRRAGFYVSKYGAGVDRKNLGRRKFIIVEDANGYVKKTRNYGLFKVFPKVTKGSTVSVMKTEKIRKLERDEAEKKDWGNVFTDVVAAATAVLTLVILADRTFATGN